MRGLYFLSLSSNSSFESLVNRVADNVPAGSSVFLILSLVFLSWIDLTCSIVSMNKYPIFKKLDSVISQGELKVAQASL